MCDAEKQEISLIIPARNAEKTLLKCLEAVFKIEQVKEVILVDDHSSDKTKEIAMSFKLTLLENKGRGISAARNRGAEYASKELIWFLDSDCIPTKETLGKLLEASGDIRAGGYLNANPKNLLSCIIQEEFDLRYSKMPRKSTYLTACNLLIKKQVFLELSGFDQEIGSSEDGEFSFRALDRGFSLTFVKASRVLHHHPTSFFSYLKKQLKHGYWVVRIANKHKGKVRGNSYSSFFEHTQLVLILLFYLLLFLVPFLDLKLFLFSYLIFLFLLQLPVSFLLFKRSKKLLSFIYAPFSFVRLFARGFGILKGVVSVVFGFKPRSMHF